MKKLIFLMIVISLLAVGVLADSADITVTLVSQDPDPVEPGEIVTVKFKIENGGEESNEETTVKISPVFPFSIYGDVTEKNIGKLRASATGGDAEIVEFKLKVDDAAVEKETEIELEVLTGTSGVRYADDEFLIDIETRDAILDITSIKYEPEQVPPGKSADIKISVKNLADSLLKDITFDLDLSSDDLPLAPYQSSSQRQIDVLNSNYQLPLSFKVIADPSASPGLYKVPLNITYYDEQGNDYFIEEILAVSVGEKPNLKSYIKKSTVLQSEMPGKVTLEVANAGTTDVKFLEITILPSEDFELVSTSNYFYIGDVDSDDTESEELDVYIIADDKESLIFPVELKYFDANNQVYTELVKLELDLYSTWQLKKFGVIERNTSWIWFLVIILIVVGYFIYRKQPSWLPEILRKKEVVEKKK